MHYQIGILALLWLVGVECIAGTIQSSDFTDRSKASAAREPNYEAQAGPVFWGDAAFMRKCVPSAAPLPKPFTMYVVISPSGKPTYQTAEPMTDVAQCVLTYTSSRTYPQPKQEYVFSIELRFAP
jgi:hypothetical protein